MTPLHLNTLASLLLDEATKRYTAAKSATSLEVAIGYFSAGDILLGLSSVASNFASRLEFEGRYDGK
jgi:hypothetical protein